MFQPNSRLKTPAVPRTRKMNAVDQNFNSEDMYKLEETFEDLDNPNAEASNSRETSYETRDRAKPKRIFGRGRRSFGKLNLKVDPSLFLSPQEGLELDCNPAARQKLINNLNDMGESSKGCIIWYTLEYFESSNEVVPYVDILIDKCISYEYVMEGTTKNFVSLSNLCFYGETIKTEMLNILKHIHDDIVKFGTTGETTPNPQFYFKYYDKDITMRYYKFVGLLFFRFRKHLDCYRRYKSLALPVLSGFKFLLNEATMESLKLLTLLVQMNLHSIADWYYDEALAFVKEVELYWKNFETTDQKVKCYWTCAILDMIENRSIIGQTLYNRYAKLLGPDWAKYTVLPPVQVLERINTFVLSEKMDCFHIDDYDVFRNMFVYLP